MTDQSQHIDDQRAAEERRHERQGWAFLIGGFAVAGLLVVLASML